MWHLLREESNRPCSRLRLHCLDLPAFSAPNALSPNLHLSAFCCSLCYLLYCRQFIHHSLPINTIDTAWPFSINEERSLSHGFMAPHLLVEGILESFLNDGIGNQEFLEGFKIEHGRVLLWLIETFKQVVGYLSDMVGAQRLTFVLLQVSGNRPVWGFWVDAHHLWDYEHFFWLLLIAIEGSLGGLNGFLLLRFS